MGSVGWWWGEVTTIGLLAIVAFLAANILFSRVSMIVQNAYAVEALRITVGGVIAPAAYILVEGPLAPWWQGFLIMCVGGTVVFGLITGNPRWGRLLVGYYVVLMFVSAVLFRENVNWWQWLLEAGTVAMAGLTFATIMSILGQTLSKERVRTVELQHARDALFAEVEVAQEIQTLLLPHAPEVPDHTVAGRMVPADEVGGDYFDVVRVGSRSFIAIGDVSGHGVTAGLTMMMARSSLIGVLEARPDVGLSEAYALLNRCLVRNLTRVGVPMHMTFNLMEYLGDGKFAVVGQHLPLLVYRSATQAVDELETSGAWLGITDQFGPEVFPETHFALGHGDLLFLYTDGIVEHVRGTEMFGFERLAEVLRRYAPLGPEEVIDGVGNELQRFSQEKAEDDITMLVLNHDGGVKAA